MPDAKPLPSEIQGSIFFDVENVGVNDDNKENDEFGLGDSKMFQKTDEEPNLWIWQAALV